MFGIRLKEDRWKRRLCLLFGSAALVLSFSPFDFFPLAFVSILLLLSCLGFTPLQKSFRYGYFFGFLFYFVSLYWISHVTGAGWVFAAFFQALYIGLFAVGARFLMDPVLETNSFRTRFIFCLGVPGIWVFLEWLRVNLIGFGFGWNLLSYSQISFLNFIQIADVIGAYGISFVIVLIACLFFLSILDVLKQAAHRWIHLLFYLALAAALLLGLLYYGSLRLKEPVSSEVSLRVGAIQGNIPQEVKWNPAAKEKIIEKYIKLSEILNYDRPDMMIWPEAAYPGFFNTDFIDSPIPKLVDETGIPLLLGAPRYVDGKLYNSAYLVEPGSQITDIYNKQRLVPFGEYIPFKSLFFFLEKIADSMGVGDFSKGDQFTVFAGPLGTSFAALICFENIFPEMTNKYVKQGSQFFVVITNDAWFHQSSAPWQHFVTSSMRAIETRRPFVFVANTGITGFFDKLGRVQGILKNERGESLFISGGLTQLIYPSSRITLYVQYGWLIPWIVAGLSLFSLLITLWTLSVIRRSSSVKRIS